MPFMFQHAFPVFALALLTSAVLSAQEAAPRPRTVWDGAYTDTQAERGRTAYEASCARCHTLSPLPETTQPAAGNGGSVTGEKFWRMFQQRSVGDLLAYLKKFMPNGAQAGTLPAATYNDLVALILQANGFPSGAAEVSPEAGIADIQIIPKDGPGELPTNVLVRVVGCLARDGTDWVLNQATAPQRIESVGTGPNDATLPLGDRSYPLKFVLTRLDRFNGQRMSVSGLLIGRGGINGINVSQVSAVAAVCP
jgi:hypothetical protein